MSDDYITDWRRGGAESDERRRRRSRLVRFGMSGFIAAAFIGGLLLPTPQSDGPRIACDNAVRSLMTSRDLIEITRGDALIRQLNCSVLNRIDAEGRFQPTASR